MLKLSVDLPELDMVHEAMPYPQIVLTHRLGLFQIVRISNTGRALCFLGYQAYS